MKFSKISPQPHQEFLGIYSPGASTNPGNNLQDAVNNGSYSNAVKVVKRKYYVPGTKSVISVEWRKIRRYLLFDIVILETIY